MCQRLDSRTLLFRQSSLPGQKESAYVIYWGPSSFPVGTALTLHQYSWTSCRYSQTPLPQGTSGSSLASAQSQWPACLEWWRDHFPGKDLMQYRIRIFPRWDQASSRSWVWGGAPCGSCSRTANQISAVLFLWATGLSSSPSSWGDHWWTGRSCFASELLPLWLGGRERYWIWPASDSRPPDSSSIWAGTYTHDLDIWRTGTSSSKRQTCTKPLYFRSSSPVQESPVAPKPNSWRYPVLKMESENPFVIITNQIGQLLAQMEKGNYNLERWHWDYNYSQCSRDSFSPTWLVWSSWHTAAYSYASRSTQTSPCPNNWRLSWSGTFLRHCAWCAGPTSGIWSYLTCSWCVTWFLSCPSPSLSWSDTKGSFWGSFFQSPSLPGSATSHSASEKPSTSMRWNGKTALKAKNDFT